MSYFSSSCWAALLKVFILLWLLWTHGVVVLVVIPSLSIKWNGLQGGPMENLVLCSWGLSKMQSPVLDLCPGTIIVKGRGLICLSDNRVQGICCILKVSVLCSYQWWWGKVCFLRNKCVCVPGWKRGAGRQRMWGHVKRTLRWWSNNKE